MKMVHAEEAASYMLLMSYFHFLRRQLSDWSNLSQVWSWLQALTCSMFLMLDLSSRAKYAVKKHSRREPGDRVMEDALVNLPAFSTYRPSFCESLDHRGL